MLPAYLIPARIEITHALPQTTSGKIDRRGLRGTPPATPTEELVAEVWRALLDVRQVSREDDFFALGGDSILILRVFARLSERIDTLPRPTVIYEHATLAALAEAIDHAEPVGVREVGQVDGPFPLTPAQRGFLLAGQSWLATLRVHGRVDRLRFQRAVDTCVARHGMLRTIFPGEVQQELPASLRLPVVFEDAADPAGTIAEERARVFEPWAWPLLRLRLITLSPEEHVLVVHAHHLIGDGATAPRCWGGAARRLRRDRPAGPAQHVPRSCGRASCRWRRCGRRTGDRWWSSDRPGPRASPSTPRCCGGPPRRPARRCSWRCWPPIAARWPPSPGRTISCSASP